MNRAALMEAKALVVVLTEALRNHGTLTPKLKSWVDAALKHDFDHRKIQAELREQWPDYRSFG